MAATVAPPVSPPPAPSITDRLGDALAGLLKHLGEMSAIEIAHATATSAAIVALATGSVWLAGRLLDRAFAAPEATDPASRKARRAQAARLTWLMLRAGAGLAAVAAVLAVWGLDLAAVAGPDLGARLVRILIVGLLAVGLFELVGHLIARTIAGFARQSGDGRRAAQLKTLGPLLKGFAQTAVLILGALMLLTELGVNVAPLLASAGVVGIAVGFGAQTLVKDFLTGLFLVAEDVVSVGDNVQIGDSAGVVEAMTLRTIRLRDVNATLHIFPYSEAQVIHNRTKVFSSYLAEVPISYDTDVDEALAVIRRVGEDLAIDPSFAKLITQPFEVMGVDRLAEGAIYLKARFTTIPRAQWEVGREFNRRLVNAFEAAGIRTPVKTTPVQAQPLEEPPEAPPGT